MDKKQNLKIIAVIQARLGSKRLPEKVMFSILDKPILWHIHNRLKTCKTLSEIVISTGNSKNNEKIHDFAVKQKIPIFLGSENDLISRLFETCKKFEADAIVRITGDCPLVDPVLVDKMVSDFTKNYPNFDVVRNYGIPTFPHGFEIDIFSLKILKKLHDKIIEPKWREWFPLYFDHYPECFSILEIKNSTNQTNLRLTLDYEEDFTLIKKIYEKLFLKNNSFSTNSIISLLEENPSLLKINEKYKDHYNLDAPNIL